MTMSSGDMHVVVLVVNNVACGKFRVGVAAFDQWLWRKSRFVGFVEADL